MIQIPELWTPRPRSRRRICAPPPPPPPIGIGRKVLLPTTFTPPDLGNCVHWSRADLGIVLTSGAVSTWYDQSGHGNNLTQATSASRPGFTASDSNLGNRPSTSGYVHATGTSLVSGTLSPTIAAGTFFQVVYVSSVSTSMYFMGNNSQPQVFCNSSDDWSVYAGTATGSSTTVTAIAHVWAVSWNTTGTLNTTMWVNSSASPIITNQTASGSSALNILKVGGLNSANLSINGNIAENALYNVQFTSTQIAKLFGYAGTWYSQSWS